MRFDQNPTQKNPSAIPAPILQKIEDAILLGDVREVDDALTLVAYDEDFPDELRYGLEALRYFRAYYGTGCELEPRQGLQKQKAVIMEKAWSAEILDHLRHEGKIVSLYGKV